MTEQIIMAKPEHEVVYQELAALIGKHASTMSAVEILAVASNMVGKLVAMQDQRKTTPAGAMKIVMKNLEVGNRQAIKHLALAPAAGTA